MASVSVERQLLVRGGAIGEGQPWCIKAIERLDGSDYAPIKRVDTGLARFLLGSSKASCKDLVFLDELKAARNKAMKACFASGQGQGPPLTKYHEWKEKQRAKMGVLSKTVEWTFPALGHPGDADAVAPETTIRFKRVDHENAGVTMEVTEEALNYLFHATRNRGSRQEERSRPKRLQVPVRWNKQKGGWLANRSGAASKKWRLFRVRQEGEEASSKKRRRALSWADGCSDLSGSDAEGDEQQQGALEGDEGDEQQGDEGDEQQGALERVAESMGA